MNTENKAHPSERSGSEKRLEFETFLADLSARFVALPPDRVDDEIRNALKEVLEFFQIDRCALMRLMPDKTHFQITHNAVADGIEPFPIGTALPVELFPWTAKRLGEQREVVSFARPEELLAEAATDKQAWKKFGIGSGLFIPVAVLRSSEYSFGTSSGKEVRNCPKEYIPRLRLLGELFVNAVERSRGELALRQQKDEIERLKLQLEKENLYLREEIKTVQGFEKIIGKSEKLQYILFRVKEVAPTDATVLILGETGTGKGLVAHAIHDLSARKDRPMITVNCAALPGNLIESELFGREKGAFTGAHAKQVGRFEVADGGTIFLDEIGEMPLELQGKLLRVLEEGEFERLGSPKTIKVNVRVIASTNRDLEAEVKNKRFREDLYYRLNVFPVSIPPLRTRAEDIPQLISYFVEKYARKFGRKYETVSRSMMKAAQEHFWPGNVRELEHVIERAVIISPGPVLQLVDPLERKRAEAGEEPVGGLETIERDHILRVLQETRWKIEGEGGAASVLKLHPNTLRSRIKKLGIKRPLNSTPLNR